MSFILNALKKSDELRGRERATDTGKIVLDLGAHHHSPRSFRVILLLLPLALLIGWWLGSSPISKKGSAETVGMAPHDPEKQPASHAAEQQITTRKLPVTTTPITAKQQAAGAAQIMVETAPVPISPTAPARATTREEESRDPGPEAATPLPLAVEAIPYTDLPRHVRQALPPLEISLHFFSDNPERRMVRITGHFYHEGETVDTGLSIHSITPSTTIFDYQDLLFEVDKPGG